LSAVSTATAIPIQEHDDDERDPPRQSQRVPLVVTALVVTALVVTALVITALVITALVITTLKARVSDAHGRS